MALAFPWPRSMPPPVRGAAPAPRRPAPARHPRADLADRPRLRRRADRPVGGRRLAQPGGARAHRAARAARADDARRDLCRFCSDPRRGQRAAYPAARRHPRSRALSRFRATLAPAPGTTLALWRLADRAWLAGDPPAARFPAARPDGRAADADVPSLIGTAQHPRAGITAIAERSLDATLADWRADVTAALAAAGALTAAASRSPCCCRASAAAARPARHAGAR